MRDPLPWKVDQSPEASTSTLAWTSQTCHRSRSSRTIGSFVCRLQGIGSIRVKGRFYHAVSWGHRWRLVGKCKPSCPKSRDGLLTTFDNALVMPNLSVYFPYFPTESRRSFHRLILLALKALKPFYSLVFSQHLQPTVRILHYSFYTRIRWKIPLNPNNYYYMADQR